MNEFIEAAIEAGFSREQAIFMEAHLAAYPHSHSMDEVEGLDEALEGLEEDEEVSEDD